MARRYLSIALILLLFVMTTNIVFADDSQESVSKATLSLLVVSQGQTPSFSYNPKKPDRASIWWMSENPYSTEILSGVFDYKCKSKRSGILYMSVIANPCSDDAIVNVYATTARNMNFTDYMQDLTGKAFYNSKNPKPYPDNNAQTYHYYQFVADNGKYTACTFRVEVTEGEKTNNYNVICQGSDCNDDDVLSQIKSAFVDTVDNQTDVSDFTSSAKALVETAKPIFKSMMEQATTEQEACRIANQFNMLVCNAKEIEDETTDLKDELEGAKTALGEVDTKVKTAAQSAVAAARELDTEKFSEEDAAAIEGALSALETELAKEDAKTADILDAKEALDKAVIDAKVNALETEKAAVEEDLKEANAALETATEETIPGLQKTIKDLNDKIDQLEKDLKAAKDEYDKAAAENEELLKQIEDLTKAKESAEKQLKAVKDELRNVTNLLVDQSIESALDHAESVINTTVKELSNTSAAIADNALRKVIEAANEAINKATADLSGVLGSNAEAMNKMIERFDGASDRLSKAGERLAEAIATGGTSAREKAELRKQIKEAAAELEKAQKDIETLRADLDKASDGSELQKQIEDLTGELSTAKGELEQTKADLEAAQAALLLATKPAKVDTISVQAGKKKVTVTWSETERAEGFVVYRSLKKKKGYKAVKTIKSGATFKYTDKKVVQGKKYFYKVRAYKMYDGNKLYGAYSAVKKTGKVQ